VLLRLLPAGLSPRAFSQYLLIEKSLAQRNTPSHAFIKWEFIFQFSPSRMHLVVFVVIDVKNTWQEGCAMLPWMLPWPSRREL
jgi:hypothetical protein